MSEEYPGSLVSDCDLQASGVVVGTITMLTLAVAFGLLALGWSYFWIAFPIGFGGVLPTALAVLKRRDPERSERADRSTDRADRSTASDDDALDTLREQYARGEIDEIEFERRVERLLETESIEDAETAYSSDRDDPRADERYERGRN